VGKIGLHLPQVKKNTKIEFLPYEHIELPAKPLDYFLRSNTSNINEVIQATFGRDLVARGSSGLKPLHRRAPG